MLHEETEGNCACKLHKAAYAFESSSVNFSIYHVRSTITVIQFRP